MRLLCVLAALLVAGCLNPVTDNLATSTNLGARFDPDWHERVPDVPPGHDHRDPKQHENRTTPNWEILGHNGIISDIYGTTTSDYGCGTTITHKGRRLSVVPSFTSDVAFYLLDTTDLTKPIKVAELYMSGVQVYDITMTQDQRFVLLATSPYEAGPDTLRVPPWNQQWPIMTWRSVCNDAPYRIVQGPLEQLPYADGLVLIDIQDLARPRIIDYRPVGIHGGHSLQSYVVKGRELMLLTVFDFVHETSYYMLWQLKAGPGGTTLLDLLSIIPGLEPDGTIWGTQGVAGVHDGYLGVHPILDRVLAYLAVGPTGFRIYDIEDPTRPVFLGMWKDFSPFGNKAPPTWYFHSALAIDELWDGRHYTFLSEECPTHRQHMASCVAVILDTTDPRKPTFVGAWAMPVDAPWEEIYQFSTHHIAVHNRTFFLTVYHAGLWAIDVSTPEALRTMPSIGAFVPTLVPDKHVPGMRYRTAVMGLITDNSVFQHAPGVLDVDVVDENGTLLVTDDVSGIYLVRFDKSNPAPAPSPWPLHYNE